ncbi:MAG: TrkA family potassium uptake protein [Labilithrix sp.]|nr:TrkA family potassium uptake protein [Labilithrix sp.]MCW5813311.1 TrkA family potassium uptake protein [Labilithrix sp.]
MNRKRPQPDFATTPSLSSPIFWHFVWKMVPWLVATAVYIVAAASIVRWDMGRIGEAREDFGAEMYGMYTQLFFEPTATLPHAPIARFVFWITPALGVLLLVRGVVRVGASVFDVEERRNLWVKIMTDRMKGHIVVCGLGHVGIRIVESLKALGVDVVAIERDKKESFVQTAERLSVPVHHGDARQDDLLSAAGIARAHAVVCATDDDFTNLEVAIDAKRENPDIRVVMRVFDQRVAEKIGSALDIEKTFSASALAGPLIALQAISNGVLGVYRSNGDLRVDMEISAPSEWDGKTVVSCEDEIDGRIVALARSSGKQTRPRHDTKIERGDHLTIDLPASMVGTVERLTARDAARK